MCLSLYIYYYYEKLYSYLFIPIFINNYEKLCIIIITIKENILWKIKYRVYYLIKFDPDWPN